MGDNAFYDSGQAGIDALAAEYGVETRTIEANFDAGKYEPSLQAAVGYADVIFVISYGFEDQLKEIADKNPDKVFVNIDTVVENSADTITSVDFIEEESAYLAGVVAGMLTTDTSVKNINAEKIVGVVGGDVDPVVSAFVFAYENGAQSVDPEIVVETKSLGGAWDDAAKGKQAALQLYDQKADVVFQVAAAAGIGTLQAAARARALCHRRGHQPERSGARLCGGQRHQGCGQGDPGCLQEHCRRHLRTGRGAAIRPGQRRRRSGDGSPGEGAAGSHRGEGRTNCASRSSTARWRSKCTTAATSGSNQEMA